MPKDLKYRAEKSVEKLLKAMKKTQKKLFTCRL